MCTLIARSVGLHGRYKAAGVWGMVTRVLLEYDHPTVLDAEHALMVRIVGADGPNDVSVAMELSLDEAEVLMAALRAVTEEAHAHDRLPAPEDGRHGSPPSPAARRGR